jgi:hypothetical protein
MTNRLLWGIAVVAVLILASPLAYGQDASSSPPPSSAITTVSKTIAGDMKPMVSAGNVLDVLEDHV